jgi:iron complex transport system substrate-binding protein
MRIVSLLPSATEIVAALGLADQLVGRSHECDFPPGVERLPALCAPKLRIEGSSREIDRDVKALVANGLSVYRVDAERLRDLAPDVIVTQTQCGVCAVAEADVLAATCNWAGASVRIVSLAPNRLEDVFADVERVAGALHVQARGAAVVAGLRERLDALAARTSSLAKPAVACIEWLDPLMAAGNWVPELVEIAGGRNLFGEAGEHSPWLEWEVVRRADPDVVVAMPCGFDLARTRRELSALERLPGWPELRAVREGRLSIVDGHQYFNRPGPRLVESAEILAEILHPGVIQFGHRGRGWTPIEVAAHA